MKIQDLVFLLVLGIAWWRRDARLAIGLGLTCLALAMPLFQVWKFFTAERLTWYAAGLILSAIVFQLWRLREVKR